MDAKLAEIAEEFDREAEDSTVTRKNGKFIITEEKDGLKMDKKKTIEAVTAVMDTRMSGEALIAAEVTKAEVTAEDNEHVTDLIGTYYTTFNNSDRNRNTTLAVGCNYINGTILAPGEVFSANIELGSQTAAGGYKMAGVYNNGKVEQGMAGGVCQVTTTLYNAALMAELERMTPERRMLFALRFEEELTVRQIAEIMGVAEGTIKSRLHSLVLGLQTKFVCEPSTATFFA